MAKAVLDTNVVLDFLDSGRPEHTTAVALVSALVTADTSLCLPATSLKDVYYILTRTSGEPVARRAVTTLAQTMTILPVDSTTCDDALANHEPDFEDGLVRACAETAAADWIVTRDQAGFTGSSVPKTDPATLLAHLQSISSDRRDLPGT
ncbi:MAG: PIN domain-containing protein [Micrococcales bacterium]|nr:PIN domain-containing protein [Micrococcales bacterium]